LVVGDAAGYVEPFTGEGIAWALASGKAAAPLACSGAVDWRPALAERWTHWNRETLDRRRRVCRSVTWGLRRSGLTRAALGFLSHWPAPMRRVIAHLNTPMKGTA
jgi:flavin-dependent dehydrogenase